MLASYMSFLVYFLLFFSISYPPRLFLVFPSGLKCAKAITVFSFTNNVHYIAGLFFLLTQLKPRSVQCDIAGRNTVPVFSLSWIFPSFLISALFLKPLQLFVIITFVVSFMRGCHVVIRVMEVKVQNLRDCRQSLML